MSEYWEGVQDIANLIQDILNNQDETIDQLTSRQALGILLNGINQDLQNAT
jgi:hypothetical protein